MDTYPRPSPQLLAATVAARSAMAGWRPAKKRKGLYGVYDTVKAKIDKRQSAMKKRMKLRSSNNPRYTIGSYGGRFKRARRRKVKKSGNKKSVYGKILGENATYFGYQYHGGRDLLLREFAEKFILRLIRIYKVTVRDRDASIPWRGSTAEPDELPPMDLRLTFGTPGTDGTDTLNNVDIPLYHNVGGADTYKSFDTLVSDMVTQLGIQLDGKTLNSFSVMHKRNATDPASDGKSSLVYNRQIGEWKLNIRVTSVLKVQNITPADGDAGQRSTNRNDIGANPLRGRLWRFSSSTPLIRQQFKEFLRDPALGASDQVDKIQDTTDPNGLVNFPPKNNIIYDKGNALHSVPRGGTLFSNVKRTADIYLSPGTYKSVKGFYSFKGSVALFCKRLSKSESSPFRSGECLAFGLESSMKTLEDETITLAYHIDFLSSSYLKPKFSSYVQQSNASILKDINNTPSTT